MSMKSNSKSVSKSQSRWSEGNGTFVSTIESNPWRERVRTEHRFYERAHANQANTRPLPEASQEEVSRTYNSYCTASTGRTLPSPVTANHNALTAKLAQRVNELNYQSVSCPDDIVDTQ